MGQCGRNQLCECRSGAKAKRCCGLRRGPAPTELAKAFLAEQRRIAAVRLLGVKRDDFDELFDEVIDLPTRDVSMQLPLPGLLSPSWRRCERRSTTRTKRASTRSSVRPWPSWMTRGIARHWLVRHWRSQRRVVSNSGLRR